jgi:hypothetical protein
VELSFRDKQIPHEPRTQSAVSFRLLCCQSTFKQVFIRFRGLRTDQIGGPITKVLSSPSHLLRAARGENAGSMVWDQPESLDAAVWRSPGTVFAFLFQTGLMAASR